MERRYVLISPCRDEAKFMRHTLDSVIAQSWRPELWVIVDDGSNDTTPQILSEYASRYEWIRILTRTDRGKRSVGPGVVEAFNAGYATIRPRDYQYVCKIDLDLKIPPRYFETLIRRMEADPSIATCSGKAYTDEGNGRLVYERTGDEASVGMTKFYRVDRFELMGGFVQSVMWDGIDCHRCRMLGWRACSWDVPELRFVHLRRMGSSQTGILTGRMRHGAGQFFMGTGRIYMLANAINRLDERPFILGSLAMLGGYLRALVLREHRYDDMAFRRFLRLYQRRALQIGKRRATAEIDQFNSRFFSTVEVPRSGRE